MKGLKRIEEGRKTFNEDSIGKVNYEAGIQREMKENVFTIADRVRTGTKQAKEILDSIVEVSHGLDKNIV